MVATLFYQNEPGTPHFLASNHQQFRYFLVLCKRLFKHSNKKTQENCHIHAKSNHMIQTSGEAELLSIDIIGSDNNIIQEIQSGNELRVRIHFEIKRDLIKPEFVVGTHRADFVCLTAGSTVVFDDRLDHSVGQYEIVYILKSFLFVNGTLYTIRHFKSVSSNDSLR